MAGWTKEDVKQAMRGRAREVLTNVGGFDPAVLDTRREHPCPWCGGKTRFRLIDEEAGAVFCSNCFAKDNGDALAAIQRNQGWDFKTALNECARYLGFAVDSPAAEPSQTRPPIPPETAKPETQKTPLADAVVLDRAYLAVLDQLDLSADHRAHLLARGLTDEAIDRARFRTLVKGSDEEENAALAAEIAVGAEIAGVPGVHDGRLIAAGGIVIPVRNVAGQVIALKVRFDQAAEDGRRYGYVSSKKLGASCGTPCHIPLSLVGQSHGTVRATEGELKAEVATLLSGVPTIACAGVNVWRHLIHPLKALKAKLVLLAFDADALTNDKVAKQLLDAHAGLTEAGFEVQLETWAPDDGKGIDDLLAGGKSPEALAGEQAVGMLRQFAGVAESKPKKPKSKKPKPPCDEPPFDGPPLDESEAPVDPRDVIVIDARITPTHATLAAVTNALLRGGKTYLRTSLPVFIDEGNELMTIQAPPELAAVLNTVAEVQVVTQRETNYAPLPPKWGAPWLCHPKELRRLPAISVFTKHPIFGRDGELVPPGFHPENGIYYAGPTIAPSKSSDRLNTMLSGFCWRSPADRTNFLAVLLTPFFADLFIGSKPALLLNGNQPGLGKSILAQICAILRDGRPVISASYNANDEEFEKTLGARVRQGLTTIIVDNAKNRGKSASIDSAVLERSITDRILCYRLLGQSATIQAENSHQFIITANSPEVSRDLVTRSIVVSLHFEGNPEHRQFPLPDVEEFCQSHREEILGELAGFVTRWIAAGRPMAQVSSRFNKAGWGQIIGGILDVAGEPDFLGNADEVSGEMDKVLADFTQLVEIMACCEQGNWTSAELVKIADDEQLFSSELADRNPRGKATVIGVIAGRYVGEKFSIRGREWVFQKEVTTRSTSYQVRDISPEQGDGLPSLTRPSRPSQTFDF